ncbi:MAG: 2-oxo-4-hydroxy-4-carboxy-5-ureidoimidazoline decarboxylase [Chthoniobacterales bacterium]
MKRIVQLEELNAIGASEFCSALDGLWEHSPWVAAEIADNRPFRSVDDLAAAMWKAVRGAGPERQLALLQAHPDLAGKLARAGALTTDSASEQASLGLDRLDDAEYEAFTAMNRAYRERFGFPFIICVRDNTKASIRTAFESRLSHSLDEEMQNALDEVRRIAEYRLWDRMKS